MLGKYQRAWILEQVVNRPNTMRINFLAEVKPGYAKIRDDGLSLVKSFSALKNCILSNDRYQEMPLFINVSKTLEQKSRDHNLGKSTFIENLLEDKKKYNNLIVDAIDLIEEEQYDPNIGDQSFTDLTLEDDEEEKLPDSSSQKMRTPSISTVNHNFTEDNTI